MAIGYEDVIVIKHYLMTLMVKTSMFSGLLEGLEAEVEKVAFGDDEDRTCAMQIIAILKKYRGEED